MAERFSCEKCAGTGEVRWGRCHACKGRGSFASSTEQRAKRQLQRLESRKAEAQQENRNRSVYLVVMNREWDDPLFVQMRADHGAGRQWTPAQLMTARQKINGIREARALLDKLFSETRPA